MKTYGHKFYLEDLKEYQGLSKEETEWIKQFYIESYTSDPKANMKILKSPDMIKSATRANNNVKRDAYIVAEKSGKLISIDKLSKKDQKIGIEAQWRKAYKIGGYELAARAIVLQAKEDIEISKLNTIHCLLSMLESMRLLKNEYRKDKREKGKYK